MIHDGQQYNKREDTSQYPNAIAPSTHRNQLNRDGVVDKVQRRMGVRDMDGAIRCVSFFVLFF
jgi:hypothetical protein